MGKTTSIPKISKAIQENTIENRKNLKKKIIH
jgi:hypothetical protein